MTTVGDQIASDLAPIGGEAEHPRILFEALALGIQDIDDLASDSDTHPGWGALYDVDACPTLALPWLGQHIGVRIPALAASGLSEEDYSEVMRQRIRDKRNFTRGGVPAVRASIQELLTGNKTVNVHERDTSAWHISFNTYTSETPDEDAVRARIAAWKIIGLQFEYNAYPGWTVGDYEDFYDTDTIGDMEGDFASVGEFENNTP